MSEIIQELADSNNDRVAHYDEEEEEKIVPNRNEACSSKSCGARVHIINKNTGRFATNVVYAVRTCR